MGALGRLVSFFANFGTSWAKLIAWLKSTKLGSFIWFSLFTWMGAIVGKILTLIGVTLAVNEFALPTLTELVAGHLLNMPTMWVQLLALTNIDKAITIIMSAFAIAVADRVYVARRRAAWQTPL